MAGAILSFVTNVKEFLAVAKEGVTWLKCAEEEVGKLSSIFTKIQAELEDAEEQQVTRKAVRDSLEKLQEVGYEVEDILDEYAFRSQGDEQVHSSFLDRFFFRPFKKARLSYDIGPRIKKVTERLDEISMEITAFNRNIAYSISKTEERQTDSLIDESETFGRDDDRDHIINKLVCDTSRKEKSVTVVSIVGMAGLGKTTLAQLVYNDKRVKEHFERRIWFCVNDDFDAKKIATKVIKSMGGPTHENPDWETLQNGLHEVVGKERFLLVLDDVWNENDTKWGKLRVLLKNAAQGSRIVVTTRSHKVAEVMETTYTHSMAILSDSSSWDLFTSRAFKGRKEEECRELKHIGKKIVDKCNGLPLAVKAIGSLMYFKRTKSQWKLVLESKTWEWDLPKDGGILPALLLSYYSLPPHLKQCFSFCSVFPKDRVIKKDELVKLWMAHGIIRSERVELEEIGEMYFDDLLVRSLFQDAKKDDDGNIVQCKMHDLVHDLAQYVTTGDYCITEMGNLAVCSNRTHHLSLLVNSDVSSIPSPLCNAKRLHTFLLFGQSIIDEVPDSSFQYLRFLRVLDLSGTSIKSFPSFISGLKHLRYLSMRDLEITEVPESVTDLCNLQTLKLDGCYKLCKLPSDVSKMVKLRHLEIEDTGVKILPHGLGSLTSLRTLCGFYVGVENVGCKIRELKRLNLLRGNLEIYNLERVTNGDEAREAELDKKCYLSSLTLHCEGKDDEEWRTLGDDEMERMENIFDALRPPHSNLKQLKIMNYAGSKFSSWLEDSMFSSLVKVNLRDCKKCRLLPGLGKLPSLKYLSIEGADAVNVVGGGFYGNDDDRVKGIVLFPMLEMLSFESMTNWEEWELRPENGEVMPSLRKLKITNCTKLKALPDHLPIKLRKLIIKNCDELLFRPLPCLLALKTLEITKTSLEFESLPSDGWGLLESLQTLEICDYPELASLPDGLGQLKGLQTLAIRGCPLLSSLPDKLGQLEALHSITIGSCHGFTCLLTGSGQFKALQTLVITYCPLLSSLPDKLGQLEALRTIAIRGCDGFTCLLTGS